MTNSYTCAAVTQWANDILSSSHESLIQFQPKDLALLLYGIFKAHATLIQGKHSALCAQTKEEPGAVEDFSSLLPYCSLQEIQFQPSPSAPTQLRNAAHVLEMVRRLSSALAEEFPSSFSPSSSSPSSSSPSSSSPFSSSPFSSLTAEGWLEGRAFVEELRLWRWVRGVAARLRCPVEAIRRAVREFLQGEKEEGGEKEEKEEKSGPHPPPPSSSFLASPLETKAEAAPGPTPRPSVDPPNTVKNDLVGEHPPKEVLPASKKPRIEADSHEGDTAAEGGASGGLFSKLKEVLEGAKGGNAPLPFSSPGEVVNADKRTEAVCTQCPLIFTLALQGNLQYLKTLESQRRAALAACGKKNITELLAILSSFA